MEAPDQGPFGDPGRDSGNLHNEAIWVGALLLGRHLTRFGGGGGEARGGMAEWEYLMGSGHVG